MNTKKSPYQWKRVKTMCISVLAVCNVLLFLVLAAAKGYDVFMDREARENINLLLAERGVMCGSSVYQALEDCPQAYTMRADSEAQGAFARALLTGEITAAPDKGNTTVWTGDNGTVTWSASGDVEAYLEQSVQVTDADAAADRACDLMKQAGFDVSREQISAAVTDDGYDVDMHQHINGIELLGCSLTMHFSADQGLTAEGKWCTGGTEELTVRALQSYTAEQVLFAFVEQQSAVKQIISAQPVYVLSDKSGGRFTAIPCWRFSTDQGDYVMNILTGEVAVSSDLGAEQTQDIPNLDDAYNDDFSIDDEETMPQSDTNDAEDIPWDER